MGLTKAIIDALSCDSSFVDAIGTQGNGRAPKIYAMEAPQGEMPPFAVVMLGQKQGHADKRRASDLDQVFVGVSITGRDPDKLEDLGEMARLRLDRLSGTFEGVVIEDILYDGNGGGMVNIPSNTQRNLYELEEEFEVFVKR